VGVTQINEPTSEYLKLKIEKDVRDRLFRYIGIPLGGGGLAALVALIFWLPNQMQLAANSDVVQSQIKKHVNDWMNSNDGFS